MKCKICNKCLEKGLVHNIEFELSYYCADCWFKEEEEPIEEIWAPGHLVMIAILLAILIAVIHVALPPADKEVVEKIEEHKTKYLPMMVYEYK